MRKINLPVSVSFSNPKDPVSGPWGLADLIVERALAAPEMMASTETCLLVSSLYKKFAPHRRNSSPVSISVTDREYELMVPALQAALQLLAKQAGGTIPPHLVDDIARYMRAMYSAEVEEETRGELPARGTA